MKKLALFATVLVCACSKSPRLGGLQANVRLTANAKASCIDLRVTTTDGTELGGDRVAFDGKVELQIGIGSAGFPRNVVVSVQPLFSTTGCTGAKPNGDLLEQPAEFPLGGVTTITFDIPPPRGTVDLDGDGFAGVVGGGPDCNDADPLAFPGATEDCMTLNDLDCDGQGGCADSQCVTAMCAQPASQLQFTSAAMSVDTGACSSALTVESRTAGGAAAALPGGAVVSLAASPAQGVRFFSDAACTTEVSSITGAMPTSTFTFYFSAAMSGTVDVTASSGTLLPATQAQTVRPPGASQLGFLTPPRTVLSGACSPVLEVEARDGSGAPRLVTADMMVSLAVSGAGAVQLFADAACTAGMELTSITIATGQSKAGFYAKGVTAGAAMLTATASGLTPATQVVTVNAGPPARLGFVTSAQGIGVNTCSGVAQVRAEDAAGNAATLPGPLTLMLAETGVGGFTFHADASCGAAITQVPLAAAAGSLATFHFKGTTIGAAMVTVSGGGLSPALQTENIGVGPPSQLAFTTGLHTVQAGACSPAVTIEVRDASGNPVNPSTPIMVTLAGTPSAGFSLYTDAACTVPLTGMLPLQGSPSATFRFRGQRVPTQRIDASAMPLAGAGQTHTVTFAPANRLAISTPSYNVTAGTCSPSVHVDVLDQFGNAVTVSNLPVSYATTAPMATFHGAAGCAVTAPMSVTGGAGFDFRFRGDVAGPLPLTVSSGSLTPAMQTHQIDAGPATVLAFTTNTRTQTAGVCSASALTIQTQDSSGNAVNVTGGPLTVNLSANDGGFTFHDQAGCGNAPVNAITIANMSASQNFWFVGRKTGVSTITATAASFSPDTQNETINAAAPSELVITSPLRTPAVNACSEAIRFETRDGFGNVSSVSAMQTVSVDGGSSLQVFVGPACASPVPGINLNAGTNNAVFHVRGATAGTFGVSVSLPSFVGDSQPVTVTQAVTQLAFTTAAQTRQAGDCSTAVTVQTRDAANMPINAPSMMTVLLTAVNGFTFFSDATCTTPTTQLTIAAGAGSVTYYFRAVTGGPFTLGATSTGVTGASQMVTIIPAVRSGTCTIPSGADTQVCMFNPPLYAANRTFLVFQDRPVSGSPTVSTTLARCHIVDANSMECERGSNPLVTLPVVWQTVTLPTAVAVQHFGDIVCSGNGETQNVGVTNLNGITDVFTLHSLTATMGNIDDNEHYTVTVTSNTAVTLDHSNNPNCGQGDVHDLQVVKLAGATVLRGTGVMGDGERADTVGSLTPITPGRAMLLYSWQTDSLGNDSCERNVRGYLSSATDVEFRRGNGSGSGMCADDGNLNIAFERVEFPTGWTVQQYEISLPNMMENLTVNLTPPVDPTRSFIMTGSQTHGGSGLGETDLNSAQSPSHYQAEFDINGAGTQFSVSRGDLPIGAVRYTVYVVQVDPR